MYANEESKCRRQIVLIPAVAPLVATTRMQFILPFCLKKTSLTRVIMLNKAIKVYTVTTFNIQNREFLTDLKCFALLENFNQ